MTKVAINGLGRIGRAFLKAAIGRSELEIVAVNDLGEVENLSHLLKYDSVYGKSDLDISTNNGNLVISGKEIKFLQERDPKNLPWGDLDVDIVVEATGVFSGYEKSKPHLDSGAKRVVIASPVKDEAPEGVVGATVLMGVNEDTLKTCDISSNGSCTTNAASPVIQILHEKIGIQKAFLNTVHGYTATQSLVDAPNTKDPRRGRAAAVNIVPSTTGAAIAVTKAITELEGSFDGIATRVPVISGSVADITILAKRDTSEDEINNIFKEEASNSRWKGILSVTSDPVVSTDIIGEPFGAIVDLSFTKVVGGNFIKILSWYDNEAGYTNTLLHHVIKSGSHITITSK